VAARLYRSAPPEQFVVDSSLEETGFEPSVPRDTPRFREGLMSLLLDYALTEKSARTRADTTTTPGAFRGTDGSNPVPSSKESGATLSLPRPAVPSSAVKDRASSPSRSPDALPAMLALHHGRQSRNRTPPYRQLPRGAVILPRPWPRHRIRYRSAPDSGSCSRCNRSSRIGVGGGGRHRSVRRRSASRPWHRRKTLTRSARRRCG